MTLLLQGAGIQALTVAPSDPIGDTLRADAVAYWKMDEVGGTRIDATTRGNNLLDVNSNVGSAAGKIDNAAQFTRNGAKILRINDNEDVVIKQAAPFYLWTWVTLSEVAISSGVSLFQKGSSANTHREYWLNFFDLFSFSIGNTSALSFVSPTSDTFYFVEAFYDPSAGDYGGIGIAVNRENFLTANLPSNISGVFLYHLPLYVGSDDNNEAPHSGLIDEAGILHRLPSQDERDYLYNSGAGRALFPAP